MEKMGAPAAIQDEWLAADDAGDRLKIHPANHEVVKFFERLQTCWCFAPSGHLIGLAYEQCRVVLEVFGRWPDRALFENLQVMEFAAVAAAAERG